MSNVSSQPMTEKDKYADLSLKMLALLTGIVLFFPSAFGFIHAPYVADAFFYIFWITGAAGIFCHAVSFWLAKYTSKTPIEIAGIANILTILTILSFSIYLFWNVWNDRQSTPIITSIEATPVNPAKGDAVSFKAEVKDQDEDKLNYQWKILWFDTNKKKHEEIISFKNNAVWLVPSNTDSNRFYAVISVSDDNHTAIEDSLKVFINTSNMSQLSDFIGGKIQAKIQNLLSRNQTESVRQITLLRQTMIDLATDNLQTIENARDNESTIELGLERYIQEIIFAFQDPRPCCKDFPGTWPFCRKNCP